MSFSEELTDNRRTYKCSDTLEQKQEAKGVSELVCSQEVSQDQGGQENICGAEGYFVICEVSGKVRGKLILSDI